MEAAGAGGAPGSDHWKAGTGRVRSHVGCPREAVGLRPPPMGRETEAALVRGHPRLSPLPAGAARLYWEAPGPTLPTLGTSLGAAPASCPRLGQVTQWGLSGVNRAGKRGQDPRPQRLLLRGAWSREGAERRSPGRWIPEDLLPDLILVGTLGAGGGQGSSGALRSPWVGREPLHWVGGAWEHRSRLSGGGTPEAELGAPCSADTCVHGAGRRLWSVGPGVGGHGHQG